MEGDGLQPLYTTAVDHLENDFTHLTVEHMMELVDVELPNRNSFLPPAACSPAHNPPTCRNFQN